MERLTVWPAGRRTQAARLPAFFAPATSARRLAPAEGGAGGGEVVGGVGEHGDGQAPADSLYDLPRLRERPRLAQQLHQALMRQPRVAADAELLEADGKVLGPLLPLGPEGRERVAHGGG